MAGPARTATPIKRRMSTSFPAKTIGDLVADRQARAGELERDMLLQKAFDGKLNVCGTVDLAVSPATTTDIDDPRIVNSTFAFFTPLDANAAAEIGGGTMYSAFNAPGKIRITHSASAGTRSFGFVLLG